VIHALAGGAREHEQNCGFSPCLLGQKAWHGDEKSNIIGSQPSVEQSTAETLNTDMCLTSGIYEGAVCLRNRVFCGRVQNI